MEVKVYEGQACAPGEGKFAIVVSKFNRSITENLLKGALQKLEEFSVSKESITVIWVPGAFEIPQMAHRFAMDTEYQAVICLGCVIKGETPHDEHINRAVSLEIEQIACEYGIPVVFGVLTCLTVDQALARSGLDESSRDKVGVEVKGNKGAEAALAALEMLHLMEQLPPLPEEEEVENDYAGHNFSHAIQQSFREDESDNWNDDSDDFEEEEDDDFGIGFDDDLEGVKAHTPRFGADSGERHSSRSRKNFDKGQKDYKKDRKDFKGKDRKDFKGKDGKGNDRKDWHDNGGSGNGGGYGKKKGPRRDDQKKGGFSSRSRSDNRGKKY